MTSRGFVMRGVYQFGCRLSNTRKGVEFRDDDERKGTFWKDDPGDGSRETAGALDCFGRGRKRRKRGDYFSRVGARGAGGGGGAGGAWRGGAGGAVRCH